MPQNMETIDVKGWTTTSDKSISIIPPGSPARRPMTAMKLFMKYGSLVIGDSLVGPAASLLPLGHFTPFASLLATSLASVHFGHTGLGALCSFLHGGGLSGLQGRIVALLSFLSLTATLDTLESPLRPLINKLVRSARVFRAILAGLAFAVVVRLTRPFAISSELARGFGRDVLLAMLHSSIPPTGLSWVLNKPNNICQQLIGSYNNLTRSTIPRVSTQKVPNMYIIGSVLYSRLQKLRSAMMRLMTRDHAEEHPCNEFSKHQLEDWEIVDGKELEFEESLNKQSKRAAELVSEIAQLIDGCEGIAYAGWDGLIALLEDRHQFRQSGVDGLRGTRTLDDGEQVHGTSCSRG